MDYQYTMNCGLLRLFDRFDTQVDTRIPRFEYHHDDEGLATLRERYQLDLVAGQGDDWSKVLNLLRWLHGNTRHNGNITEPIPFNALNLLDYSFGKGEGFGINCRMLATVLAEACLSVGLDSRIVSIQPLNPYDFDNHVVTVVWCRSSGEWVMVDPSFNAYLVDAKGKVLSPWEARELLCGNQAVTCNDELDYNGAKHEPEAYLTYIAKDLFYMHSPVHNRFGSETLPDQKWVTLMPEGFDVLKREAYNSKWRDHSQEVPWDVEELEKAVEDRMGRTQDSHVYTSSIASFSQPPTAPSP